MALYLIALNTSLWCGAQLHTVAFLDLKLCGFELFVSAVCLSMWNDGLDLCPLSLKQLYNCQINRRAAVFGIFTDFSCVSYSYLSFIYLTIRSVS